METKNDLISKIDNIKPELEVSIESSIEETRSELEKHIDEAIDFCTKEIESGKKSGDEKKKKTYNNCRSALRKYKDFMESKKTANS